MGDFGFISPELLMVLGKGTVLMLIFLYLIFSAIIFLQVRSLNELVQIKHGIFKMTVVALFVLHVLMVLSLFFFALVIL